MSGAQFAVRIGNQQSHQSGAGGGVNDRGDVDYPSGRGVFGIGRQDFCSHSDGEFSELGGGGAEVEIKRRKVADGEENAVAVLGKIFAFVDVFADHGAGEWSADTVVGADFGFAVFRGFCQTAVAIGVQQCFGVLSGNHGLGVFAFCTQKFAFGDRVFLMQRFGHFKFRERQLFAFEGGVEF